VKINDPGVPDALGVATDTPPPLVYDLIPPDPLGSGYDDLGGLDFEDLARHRRAAAAARPRRRQRAARRGRPATVWSSWKPRCASPSRHAGGAATIQAARGYAASI